MLFLYHHHCIILLNIQILQNMIFDLILYFTIKIFEVERKYYYNSCYILIFISIFLNSTFTNQYQICKRLQGYVFENVIIIEMRSQNILNFEYILITVVQLNVENYLHQIPSCYEKTQYVRPQKVITVYVREYERDEGGGGRKRRHDSRNARADIII